ncbi:MAG: Gfo/Idh/MocA family protein [Fimbriiglobus sp.]
MPFEYLPALPRKTNHRIGCLGSGFVMRDCHLKAYRTAGFQPVAIASRNIETAASVAREYAIPTVHPDVDSLLRDPSVQILDIAVPPADQPELIRRAVDCGAGRLEGILAQKPLALSTKVGRELVELCESAGIVLSVNQNMRFDHSIRSMKFALEKGEIGEPVLATIDMRAVPHWMPWAEGLPSLSTFIMSIHHLDTFRYWLGTPDRVLASTRRDPRTKFPHSDGLNLYILEYDSGPRASAWDDVWAGPVKEGARPDTRIDWRFEGTDGFATGTIGWPGYPERVPSTIELSNRAGLLKKSDWPEAWFPDAFVGTMAQLMIALESGTPPAISARDNLETLALCEAVQAAATEHRITNPCDFLKA